MRAKRMGEGLRQTLWASAVGNGSFSSRKYFLCFAGAQQEEGVMERGARGDVVRTRAPCRPRRRGRREAQAQQRGRGRSVELEESEGVTHEGIRKKRV